MSNRLPALMLLFATALVGSTQAGAAQKSAQVYRQECGSCHVAYPTVFLPSAAWEKILAGLDKHFGDSADLLPEDKAMIEKYLAKYNYEHSRIKKRYGKRFDTPGLPLRVTQTRFFQAIHREIPDRLVTGNPKVKTYARCQLCHRGAERGSFDEDEVNIPR